MSCLRKVSQRKAAGTAPTNVCSRITIYEGISGVEHCCTMCEIYWTNLMDVGLVTPRLKAPSPVSEDTSPKIQVQEDWDKR